MQDMPRLRIYPPWATLFLSLTLIGIYLLPITFQQQLAFDRLAITEGQWFRLISNHFVHGGPAHLFHNVLPLFIGGLIYECGQGLRRSLSTLGVISFGCATSTAWIWWYGPEVMFGMGLSDALYTAIIVIVFDQYRKTGYKWLMLIPLFFIGRTVLHWNYPIYGVDESSIYFPGHTVGLAAGFIWVFVEYLHDYFLNYRHKRLQLTNNLI
jgi:membrane associated rhomboid family serine protease